MKFKLKTNSTPLVSKSKNVLISFVASSSSAYSLSVVALGLLPPAPLTKMSQGPNSSKTCLWHSSNDSLDKTFAEKPFATPPFFIISSAALCAASKFKSSNATFAPHEARALARWEQITPPAPVITTTLLSRLILKGKFVIIFFLFSILYYLSYKIKTIINTTLFF